MEAGHTAYGEIKNFIPKLTQVRLTPDNAEALMSTINRELRYSQSIPINIHYRGFYRGVGSVARITRCEKHELPKNMGFLEVDTEPLSIQLPSIFYYDSDRLLTYYSIISLPEDATRFCGLYLRRDGESIASEQMFLEKKFCEEKFPGIWSESKDTGKRMLSGLGWPVDDLIDLTDTMLSLVPHEPSETKG
jgi:hypothetical protein